MSDNSRLELGAALSVVSLAIVNVLSIYRDTAPKLSDLRKTSSNDFTTKQLLLDADVFGFIAAALIGGSAAILSRRFTPLILAGSALLLVSLWYRSVWASSTPDEVSNSTGGTETT